MQDIKALYEEYFNSVYKYLLCLTHDANLSEELTQETFCKAIEKIHTFKGNSKISVWLCQIAKNLLINEHNKNKKYHNASDEELVLLEDNIKVEDTVILNNEKLNLYKKMQKLDNNSKEVVYLRITGELSFKEIGNILNKSENWARVTFYRARRKLEEVD